MGDLSEHFSRWEFLPPDKQCLKNIEVPVQVDSDLIQGLEYLRRSIGNKSIHVLSGLRVWTDGKSLHEHGKAADIKCYMRPPLRVIHELACTTPHFVTSGIGIYPEQDFIHVDVGRALPLRWVRIKGVYYYY